MAPGSVKQLLGRGASIECLFCKTEVPIPSLPPKYYLDHLHGNGSVVAEIRYGCQHLPITKVEDKEGLTELTIEHIEDMNDYGFFKQFEIVQLLNGAKEEARKKFSHTKIPDKYCNANGAFGPPSELEMGHNHRFVKHAFKGFPTSKFQPLFYSGYNHNIDYDLEAVVERTLKLQFPLVLPEYRSSLNLTSDISTQTCQDKIIPLEIRIKKEKNNKGISSQNDATSVGNCAPSIPGALPAMEATPSQNISAPVIQVETNTSSEESTQESRESTSQTNVTPTTAPVAGAPSTNEWKKVRLPWFAGSEYRCKICSLLFFYNQDLRAHVKKSHCDPDEYLDKYETFETKGAFIVCKCCEKKIKRHFSSIRNHLTTVHGMSIEEYQEMYKFPLEYEVTSCGPIGHEEISIESGKRKRQGSDQRPGKKQRAEEEFEPRAKEWFDGCEYQCKVEGCGLVFFEAHVMILHLDKIHSMAFVDYQIQFKHLETKVEWFTCPAPECGTSLKHQKSTLEKHAQTAHDLDLRAFESKFVSSNGLAERNQVELDETNFVNWSKGRCLFVCSICLKETRESAEFWQHASSEHSFEPKEYEEQFGDPCVESVMAKCKICSKKLKHDLSFIDQHTGKVHNLSVKEYFEKYVQPKKKLPAERTRPGPQSKTQKSGKLSEIRNALQGRVPTASSAPGQKTDNHFTKWKNACIYECQICRNFSSRWPRDFKIHITTKHKISFDVYTEMFKETMTIIVNHECRICKENVLQTVGKLTPHVGRHKLSLENYYRKYMLGMEIDETVSTSPTKITVASKQTSDHVSWAEKCRFVCKHCNFESFHSSSMTVHMKRAHLITEMIPNSDEHVQSMIVAHLCIICGTKIQHTSGVITKHLRQRHDMTLQDYFRQFIVAPYGGINASEWKNRCEFKCHICEFRSCVTEDFAKHMELHDWKLDLFKEKYLSMVEQKAIHTCHLCKAAVLHESFSLEEHFARVHGTSTQKYFDAHIVPAPKHASLESHNPLPNKCSFDCKICQKIFNSSSVFQEHLVTHHATTLQLYESVHGSPLFTARYVACSICHTVVPCDSEIFTNHLISSHKMNLGAYQVTKNQFEAQQDAITPKSNLQFSWNQSKHFCGICNGNCADGIGAHLQSRHDNVSLADYNSKFVTFVENTNHQCLVCNQKIVYSQRNVEQHLRSHKMTLLQYEKIYHSQILQQHQACGIRTLCAGGSVEPLHPTLNSAFDVLEHVVPPQEPDLLDDPILTEIDAFIARQAVKSEDNNQWQLF